MLSWNDLNKIQGGLDKTSRTYSYLKDTGILLDKKSYKAVRKSSISHSLPGTTKTDDNAGWDIIRDSDPFLYDKLAYTRNPEFTCEQLSMLDCIEPKTRVLDMGCGFGFYTTYMLYNGVDVCGVDISKSNLEALGRKAKRMGKKIELVCGDLGRTPVNGNFDALVAANFLKSFVDVQKILEQNIPLLKDNGKVYVIGNNKVNVKLEGAAPVAFDRANGFWLDDRNTKMLNEAVKAIHVDILEMEYRNVLKSLGFEEKTIEGNMFNNAEPIFREFMRGYLTIAERK